MDAARQMIAQMMAGKPVNFLAFHCVPNANCKHDIRVDVFECPV